jgi:predicted metal-binding membrane protein
LGAAVAWTRLLGAGNMDGAVHAGLFLLMWFWMVGAMMLAPLAPVLAAGADLLQQVPTINRVLRLGVFLSGYLALWLSSGIAALAISRLSAGRPLLVASLIAFAGVYQLGPIKTASLLRCRNPEGFFLQHGPGFTSAAGSLIVGTSYGILCLSCCWGLMMALTAMGTAGLGWMAGFAMIIALEKLHPAGSAISRAAGIVLLAASPLVLVMR